MFQNFAQGVVCHGNNLETEKAVVVGTKIYRCSTQTVLFKGTSMLQRTDDTEFHKSFLLIVLEIQVISHGLCRECSEVKMCHCCCNTVVVTRYQLMV